MTDTRAARRRKSATVDRTLVCYDGPQVLTLRGSRGKPWICVSIPGNEQQYPIFCVQVTPEELHRYMSGHVDLRFLFQFRRGADFRLADLSSDKDGELLLEPVEPQAQWFRKEGFFSRDHSEEEDPAETAGPASEHGLAKEGPNTLTIDIDGQWEFPEFATFSDRLSECYSFLYASDALSSSRSSPERSGIEKAFKDYPWQGGGSPLHFYGDLYARVRSSDRLNVKRNSICFAWKDPSRRQREDL